MDTAEAVTDRQVAVLIDFENVGLGTIQWLFDQVSDVGRIIVKRAYADWSDARNKRDQLLELGIEPIHLFLSGSGKNSSDIRLAIDAVELLYQSPVDTFVVVSSDSDFVPLVSKLRSAGKVVFGAGRKAAASRTLVRSCDRYFYLDQPESPAAARRPSVADDGESLLVRAAKTAMDEQGRMLGSKLYQTLQRLEPSFDFRALGHSTFTRYLEASPEVRVVPSRGQGDMSVELAESSDPEGWEPKIDAAWSRRAGQSGQSISGSVAASDAANVLGVEKLSVSTYRTLQKLIDAGDMLSQSWSAAQNRVVRR
jgi:uncharacterized protein (TIGR00288 family)